jgi:3-methyladenine DNA glycosylase/8-oxoguanine DNA glycosylase
MVNYGENRLRALKVGYRAKFFERISKSFSKREIIESELRTLPKETAKQELMKLYGIGPASTGILLFESLHHYDAFDTISPWEQKIYSRLLFDKRILKVVRKRWGKWRMLAAHYIFEDLFWTRKTSHLEWLEELIRL